MVIAGIKVSLCLQNQAPRVCSQTHCGPVPSPGKLGGLWQEGHHILGWNVGFSCSYLCGS